jgi:putative membrane protein insertion efficiency factor
MNKLMLALIKSYRKLDRPPRCRYHPTCSAYGLECYQKFGFFKATLLTAFRILRCNPLFKGGYDPVPRSRLEKLFQKDYPN